MNKSDSKKTIRIFIIPILIVAILTAIDQLTKAIVAGSFTLYESRDIIKNVFSFTYVQNKGTAWGMLSGKKILFLIITTIVLILCFYVYYNIADNNKFRLMRVCILILIAGAIGNMIDRIKLGYVIDFFSFDLIDFPVFNFADIYIVCSMILIFILVLFKYKDEDIETMFKRK